METVIEHLESLTIGKVETLEDHEITKPRYTFPITSHQLEKVEKLAHTINLEKTIEQIRLRSYGNNDDTKPTKPYTEVRNELCIYGMSLNIQGRIAPRFRPMRRPCPPKHKFDYPVEHTLLSNDRQIIDLHWIYCQKLRANEIVGYKDLFNTSKPFNLELAATFVSKGGAKLRKARLIGLNEWEQFQLASIESDEVKTRWRTIRQYTEKYGSSVKNLYSHPRSRLPESRFVELPDIHMALLISRGVASTAMCIFELMTNKEIDLKSFQRYALKFRENGLLI